MAVINADSTCSCPVMMMLLEEDDFVSVGEFPFTQSFIFSELNVFTKYCIQAVGNYSAEVTAGKGLAVMTGSESTGS